MPRPPKEQDDFQVLVPLRKLLGLLETAGKAEGLADEVSRLREQLTALRGQFLELLEKFKELE